MLALVSIPAAEAFSHFFLFCLQGDDAVHDAIRQRELEVGVPKRVKFALTTFGSVNDDVLWAALFVLAVLVRDSSTLHERTTRAIAGSNIVEVLKMTVQTYTARQDEYSQVGLVRNDLK